MKHTKEVSEIIMGNRNLELSPYHQNFIEDYTEVLEYDITFLEKYLSILYFSSDIDHALQNLEEISYCSNHSFHQ
jgi:hypothetical protein